MSEQPKIKAWSYSSLSDYYKCAHAWMYRRIIKKPEPRSIYLVKGEAIHKQAEDFINGEIKDLPLVLIRFNKEFHKLREHGFVAEEEIVLDSQWQHLPDGWEHDLAWLRLKTDARKDNFVIDFKTGKYYSTHDEQAKLYATALMSINPEWQDVEIEFWYLDSGMVRSYNFHRTDLDDYKQYWQDKVDKMMNDETYEPTQHEYCKYCYVKNVCPLFLNQQ